MTDRPELLRRAAAKVRETAQAAHQLRPGPWHVKADPHGNGPCNAVHNGQHHVTGYTRAEAADHIALWHPGVAMAVHHWLLDEAHDAAEDDDVAHPYALSLARRLLNEEADDD